MKPGSIFVVLLLLATARCGPAGEESASASAGEAGQPEATVLFDGSTLDGWNILGGANWHLDESDGSVMANTGTEGHLVTRSSYDDFELTLEFWAESRTNSGVYIRCQYETDDDDPITARNCYEVNISDLRADQTYRTGGIVSVSSPSEVVNAGGRWNTFVIGAEGPRLTIRLNGIEIVDVEDSTHPEGVIGLQFSVGVVKFRNVRIRTL